MTILCAWAYAPALVILAFAPTPLTLAAALFTFGAMDVAMNGWGAEIETRIARSTMSIFHAMFSLGAGVGAASGLAAIGMGLGPELHFIVVALAGGAIALTAMGSVKKTVRPPRMGDASQPLVALPTQRLFLVGLIAFAVSMGEGAMADWSAVFLAVAVAATEAQAALGYAIFSAAMVLTRLCGGILTERFGPVTTVRASATTAFLGLATAIMGQDLSIVLIGFIAQITGMRLSFIALAGLAVLASILAPKLDVKVP